MTEDIVRLGVCLVMVLVMAVLNHESPEGDHPTAIFFQWTTLLGTIGFLGAAVVVAVGLVF